MKAAAKAIAAMASIFLVNTGELRKENVGDTLGEGLARGQGESAVTLDADGRFRLSLLRCDWRRTWRTA
jgi:hypothetical protein